MLAVVTLQSLAASKLRSNSWIDDVDMVIVCCVKLRAVLTSALVSFCLLFCPLQANADTSGAKDPIGTTSEEMQNAEPQTQMPNWFRDVVHLIRVGKYQAARDLTIARFPDPVQRDIWLRYVDGLVLKRQGNFAEAAEVFRGILADFPKSQAIRAELAHTLFLARDDAAARSHYDLLLTASEDEQTAALYRHRLTNIKRRRSFRMSGYLSLAQSSNINNGTKSETITIFGIPFQIDEASRQKSGLGLAAGLRGSYRLNLGQTYSTQFGAGVDMIKYKASTFDSLVASVTAIPQKDFSWGHIGLGVIGSMQFERDDSFVARVGPRAEVFARLSKSTQIKLASDYVDVTYDNFPWLNGGHLTTAVTLTQGLSITQTAFLFGGFHKVTTNTPHNDYHRPIVGLGLYKEWPYGILTYVDGRFSEYRYSGLFPGTSAPRKDKEMRFLLRILKRDFSYAGFAPRVEISYRERNSNVSLFSYDSLGFNINMTREF